MTITLVASLMSSTNAVYASNSIDDSVKKLFSGIASWYGTKFHGRRTASGTVYNMHSMTCAHKTLPFGTKLIVENTSNGKTCQVTVTDRGPYHGKRVIDLSKAAADKLGLDGIGNVVCYLGKVVGKGLGTTAKGIEGTAKETSEHIAKIPAGLGKVAKEIGETAKGLGETAKGATEVAKAPMSPDSEIAAVPVSKPISRAAMRKEIERYYANRTLSYEAREEATVETMPLVGKGSLDHDAKTSCLLVPDGGINDKQVAGRSALAVLGEDM